MIKERVYITMDMNAIVKFVGDRNDALAVELEARAFEMMRRYQEVNGLDTLNSLGVMLANDPGLFAGQISPEEQEEMDLVMFNIVQLDETRKKAVDNLYGLVLDLKGGSIHAEKAYITGEPEEEQDTPPSVH